MRLTTRSEYTILALLYLARHESEGFIRIEDICSESDISKKYLEMLFTVLKQNRYIRTKRGTGGGYKLAKPAVKISIAEIVRLMDGALAPTEAVSKYFYSETPLTREKKAIRVFREIRDYVAWKLEDLKLSDLT